MAKILLFGNLGVFYKDRQQSTVVRVSNIAKKLDSYGHSCSIDYAVMHKFGNISNLIDGFDIVIFHRIQGSKQTLFDLKQVAAFLRCKQSHKKVIFDFDDAIFLTYPLITQLILAQSDLVFAGSHYLYEYASRFNRNTYLVPSAVDTDVFKPPIHKAHDKVIIGWHGSVSGHLKNLVSVMPIMQILSNKYDFKFKLLGTAGSAKFQNYFRRLLPNMEFDFGPERWVAYEELPKFMSDIDISISPLLNSSWNTGKCAMKALESMALGIPVVADAVGEHNFVIRNEYNGFLANSAQEWINYLSQLISDGALREKISSNSREFIVQNYSLDSISTKIDNIIKPLEK
jgi:glycosyltransferase involved in cell wall biosynthesis